MTVRELIEKLEYTNQDAEVFVIGFEEGAELVVNKASSVFDFSDATLSSVCLFGAERVDPGVFNREESLSLRFMSGEGA